MLLRKDAALKQDYQQVLYHLQRAASSMYRVSLLVVVCRQARLV
jgi:hypothetical protein